MVRERRESELTHAARCAVAAAQDHAHHDGRDGREDPADDGTGAAMNLAAVGAEVAEQWRDDPAEAAGLVVELTARGEFTVREVLDAATDACVTAALLALQHIRTAPDPGAAAERCLDAVPYLVLAVRPAGTDPD
ncbi:hypothetical protein ACFRMQ_21370 [Kitasatospora sp. NPDC056783]|uniref:hypothetical protein n=1 Tax=Kitasatospora sp. NPDC056783 TaxID=3345943 RepID=UPI0036C950CC